MDSKLVEEIVSAAIAAPSGHNAQPWLFKSLQGDCILVMPDKSRRLPVLDPFDRELFISLGCAVENMCIAATIHGMQASVVYEVDKGVSVSFAHSKSVVASPLLGAIYKRHTNRNVFDGTELPKADIDRLAACDGVRLYARGTAQFDAVADGIVAANKDIYGDRSKRSELGKWIRYNRREADEERDGIGYDVIGVPNMPAWVSKAATSFALNASLQSRTDVKKLQSSPFVAAFASAHDIEGWIQCGRRLQRFLLTAALLDVACAFIGAPCEVDSVAAGLTAALRLPLRIQVLLRVGHALPPPAFSRRRSLYDFILV